MGLGKKKDSLSKLKAEYMSVLLSDSNRFEFKCIYSLNLNETCCYAEGSRASPTPTCGAEILA